MTKQPLDLTIRLARREDLDEIIALYADDEIGAHGDTTDNAARANYQQAFDLIAESQNESVYIAAIDGLVVGTFHAAFLRKLTGQGTLSMVIQAVQTRREFRGQGIGRAMMSFAEGMALEKCAEEIQLVSNNDRLEAHRFYLGLGFKQSHFGFKKRLK